MGPATTADADAALARAERFLLVRLRSGRYSLACHGSDGEPRFPHDKGSVFVGYFLAAALGDRLMKSDRELLLERILAEEQDGLWGYSPPAPEVGPEHEPFIVDADDTAFVLRTCRLLGAPRPVEPLLRFFRRSDPWWKRLTAGAHAPARGGFTTFASPRRRVRLVAEPSVIGNLHMHPEVNANVFAVLRGTRLEEIVDYRLLRSSQAPAGHWPAYFYPSRYWATAMVLELGRGSAGGHPAGREAIDRAVEFLAGSQNPDGSWGEETDPYETALAMRGLLAVGAHSKAVERAGRFLLDCQEPDGSWSSDRVLWQFHETDHDIWIARDTHRALTTALCFGVVRQARSLRPAREPSVGRPKPDAAP